MNYDNSKIYMAFKVFISFQAPVTVTNESEVALTKGKETQFIFEIDSDGNSIEVCLVSTPTHILIYS